MVSRGFSNLNSDIVFTASFCLAMVLSGELPNLESWSESYDFNNVRFFLIYAPFQ